ncbi:MULTISPECIES: FAD-binding oxidoreductase [unclassified Rathayibacter]|uniref:FAD-binding oxidoreductase n=1 Tax=unclassified Rathayibacter TaxID=2609250 RepID=UPI00188D6FDD|nr:MULTISPECIES: FAD-binding oxidoreductase [unclassified Rathayibacter]MBF4461021.1 FAD-binding oxidoreductase [Rathayibacter sp. VKM Ac-2879]MBF4502432.1 FAD-binding oxidoreductase [Rathayibacter sp. VKM Ac-2878]
MTVAVSSWGLLSHDRHRVVAITSAEQAQTELARGEGGVARGAGRSYGDVALNGGGALWDFSGFDRLLGFEEETGVLRAEPGVLLKDIQAVFAPRGWMLPVTPGTKNVTLAGAIANDVHGKNHSSAGTFGRHLVSFTLMRSDGSSSRCTPTENVALFEATVGGLGLTGLIVEVELALARVPGPWLVTEDVPFASLEQYLALVDESRDVFEHTVAWIDVTTGGGRRGVYSRGDSTAAPELHVTRGRSVRVPFEFPLSVVNRATLPLLNRAYYRLKASRAGRSVQHYEQFYYPLDAIEGWNGMYGPRGFYQYQSTVPWEGALEVTRSMLATIAASGTGSFLGVLKSFGELESPGLLSFPAPGVCFALDFPRTSAALPLFERLDELVLAVGGRLYPAKDARMSREMFEAGYPRLADFTAQRDPGISSGFSRRVLGS